jgi:hypothetical protein
MLNAMVTSSNGCVIGYMLTTIHTPSSKRTEMMTIQEVMILLGFILVIVLFTAEPCEAGDQRIGVMPFSEHFNERSGDDDWNEYHKGIVYEHKLTEAGDWVGAMVYDNSIDNTSVTVYGINDSYFTKGTLIDAGLVYGAVTGYEFALIPYVLPTISVHSGQFRARTVIFPLGVATQFMLEF